MKQIDQCLPNWSGDKVGGGREAFPARAKMAIEGGEGIRRSWLRARYGLKVSHSESVSPKENLLAVRARPPGSSSSPSDTRIRLLNTL
jgi:hypothetical protein